METNHHANLDAIFRPESVAFIGASNQTGKWGNHVLKRALNSGYRGRIFPINPRENRVLGLKAFPDVLDVPAEVDLAVFTVPAAHVPGIMERCVRKGVKGGVVITAGFSETGPEGRALEEQAVRAARNGGLRFVGPNGMGIWSSAVSLNLSLDPVPSPGSLAFVSQSGTFGGSLAQIAGLKGYGLSKFISIGNQADLAGADYLTYLAQDHDTRVIALYMEGFKDGRRFFETAREVVKVKPILIYKGGKSAQGARATLSHTASIAGTDEVFDAMCRQAGIIRVNEVEHLFVAAEALVGQPLPRGNRVVVLGSGGQGVVTVDACASHGLEIPELDAEAKLKIKAFLPPHAPTPSNPVDFAAGGRTAVDEARLIESLAQLDYVDGIITNAPVTVFQSLSVAEQGRLGIEGAELLASIPKKYGKPVITVKFRGLKGDEIITEILKSAGVPIFQTPEDCARAMAALVRYARIRDRV